MLVLRGHWRGRYEKVSVHLLRIRILSAVQTTTDDLTRAKRILARHNLVAVELRHPETHHLGRALEALAALKLAILMERMEHLHNWEGELVALYLGATVAKNMLQRME